MVNFMFCAFYHNKKIKIQEIKNINKISILRAAYLCPLESGRKEHRLDYNQYPFLALSRPRID